MKKLVFILVAVLCMQCGVEQKPNSKFGGVQIGAITYSYRTMPDQTVEGMLEYILQSGINSVELLGAAVEKYAGMPEEREAAQQWRTTVSMDKFKEIKKMYDKKGVTIHLVNFGYSSSLSDAEIDYYFEVCKTLGAKGIVAEISEETGQRLAPFADKHNLYVVFHNHGQPGTPGFSFDKTLAYGPRLMLNLDVGHYYGATGLNPCDLIKRLNKRIFSLHLKDKTGPKDIPKDSNRPFGEGQTPLVEILQLIQKEKWPIYCDIELEYRIPQGSDDVTEVIKCVEYCRKALVNNAKEVTAKNDYYVAAYIWPSCHDDPMGREKLWADGIGEWEVIKKGNPRYEGHYQPKMPLWGYELDNDPKVVEKWINIATDHGVNVFIYDWYWYDEGPYLESALNDGFLKAKNNEKMYFYVMWANHDVRKNYWNYHRYGDDVSLLWDAAVDWKNYQIIVDRIIKQYFHKPNYFKIDGQPVFAVFSLEKLMQSFGGSVEETSKALDYFREEAKKAGFPGVHFQLIPGGGSLRTPEEAKRTAERIEAIGFNSVTMYNMGGMSEDYIVYGTNSIRIREQWDEALNIPFFPCTSVGWDDTPRFPAYGMNNTVHYNNSPESFAALLSKAKRYADNHPNQPKLMTINAWNEWVEGSYLLPDMKYGFGYLEAVKDVMDGKYDRYLK